jgi:hypothetical protein
MARVYLDTSFFSACATERRDAGSVFRREQSLQWWRTQGASHELCASLEVRAELDSPGHFTRAAALGYFDACAILAIDDRVRGLATIFVAERLMPAPATNGDAIHVAASCVHRVDYLLSWNIRHLANPNKIRHLGVLCTRLGVLPPRIITPDSLWNVQP